MLAELPADDLAALDLTTVSLARGQHLLKAGEACDYIHFIDSGRVLVWTPGHEDGGGSAAQILDDRAAVGLAGAFRAEVTLETAAVLTAGSARRIRAVTLRRVLETRPGLAHAVIVHLSRAVARLQMELGCSRHHSAEQRLARLLLSVDYQASGHRLVLTHEEMAHVLGVQRSTVSAAAGTLKARGLIAYLRGSIRLVDRAGLTATACACAEPTLQKDESLLTA